MADERAREEVPAHAPEKVEAARSFCVELLARLGADVGVEIRESPDAIAVALTPRPGNPVDLGAALVEAMQVLANRVANPTSAGRKWVNLEVGGFGESADPAMRAMAARLAESARRTGKTLAIAPISARERRSIHLALAGEAGIATRSEGEGLFRTLLVVPGAKPGGEPSR
ncbi:MAG TPA: R3H domain-containing nucleic acid-binding protein [Anaeromyxobacteraceae bacterium]|nr:R3H domain-containing nucleic acid-binding protein [Anaeromyxobacteraceae bacterium]